MIILSIYLSGSVKEALTDPWIGVNGLDVISRKP